jgi:hypothetical protein
LSTFGIETPIRINVYKVISRAVEEGVTYGYHRSFKHTDNPSEAHVVEQIERAVMNELCDVLQFGNDE